MCSCRIDSDDKASSQSAATILTSTLFRIQKCFKGCYITSVHQIENNRYKYKYFFVSISFNYNFIAVMELILSLAFWISGYLFMILQHMLKFLLKDGRVKFVIYIWYHVRRKPWLVEIFYTLKCPK